MQKVYVVIVTYNSMKWLPKCLDTIDGYPVIIIDNFSIDGTVNYLKENYPEYIILPQHKNLGFGKANNIGISKALELGAEAVFLMNQDVYLNESVIENLFVALKNNPSYGIISPIHLNAKGNELDRDFARYCLANRKIYADSLLNNKKESLYEMPFVNAAAWLVSKECFCKIGGFDPNFFHYGEDENFCQRVAYHGLKIGIHNQNFICHDTPDIKSRPKKLFSSTYYLAYKKFIFVKFANINKAFDVYAFEKEKKNIAKKIIKSFVGLKLKYSLGYFKQLKLLYSLKKEIKKSRELNKKEGKHYISC